jgi:hypothetical protein
MATRIEIVPYPGIDEGFLMEIRTWVNQVLERTELSSLPPRLCINIWRSAEELDTFYQKEKKELGVFTGEETEFLATHEAWRGYPRIHICQERLSDIPVAVIQGVLHHEISHALHHGSLEFYTFRFSSKLQEAGRSIGLDLPLLQQCVYFLSIAIKDLDVVQRLADIGFGFSQRALLEYLISDTEEEHRVWEVARKSPALRKIALSAFLKILLPVEAMISMQMEEAQALREKWNNAYSWLSERKREALFRFAQRTLEYEGKTFQNRLEHATLDLINDPSL